MTAPGALRGRGVADPLTVGVLYPPAYHQRAGELDEEVEHLLGVDPLVRVLVQPYEDPPALRTRRSAPGYRRGTDRTPLDDAQREVLAASEVLLALDLPFDTPAFAPGLRWVQSVGAGIGQLRSAGLAEASVRVTNAAGTAAPEIAEFVLARILEHHTRLPRIASDQRAARWRPHYGRPVAGTTVGLVGFGAINQAVAALARAVGMRVLATRRDARSSHPLVERTYPPDQLAQMLCRCDVVVAALPETSETAAVFDAAAFAAMPTGALFCNVGRGSSVVDEDLLGALDSGHLGGAALDVFDVEPLPGDHPYWGHPAVRVSAHCSSVPSVGIRRVHELFRDNVRRYLAGQPLRNEVDLDRGY